MLVLVTDSTSVELYTSSQSGLLGAPLLPPINTHRSRIFKRGSETVFVFLVVWLNVRSD